MRFLRNAILAVGLMGLAGACGGKDKGAEEPAMETTPPATEGEMPADPAATPEEGMGEEGMGGDEAAPEGGEGGEGGESAW
jgi:hypothetical protein